MKKKNLLLAAMGIALAGCSDDLTGITAGPTTTEEAPEAIMFGNIADHMTRATTGESAANLLGKKIYFYGEKVTGTGTNATHTPIFDNYSLEYDGDAGSTATNVAGWEYVGKTSKRKASQDAKYWDYNSNEYNFVAVSANALPEDDDYINGAATADDIKINVPDASSVDGLYVADRITRTPTEYKQTVTFNFRRLGARMRIGFYETVPGYAIKNLIFYYVGAASGSKTLGVGGAFPVSGKYNVSFDSDNKATVKFNGGSNKMEWSSTFGELDYTSAKSKANDGNPYIDENGKTSATEEKKFLGTNATDATYAKGSYTIDGNENTTSDYKPILPNENNSLKMQLRVDYTLVALDGSGDEINVRDAYVSVPVEYLKWKPNYAYTYLFKISDKSNGYTGKGGGDGDPDTPGRQPDPDNGGGDNDPTDQNGDGDIDPPYVPDPNYPDPDDPGKTLPPYIPDPDDPTGTDSIPNPDVPLIPNPDYPGNDPKNPGDPVAPDGDQGDPSNPVPTPKDPDDQTKEDPTNPANLYPITFDACVEEVTENTQETVTTVSTPSITATQEGQAVTENNEFVTSLPIILTVQDGVTPAEWVWYRSDEEMTEKEAETRDATLSWYHLSNDAKAEITAGQKGYYVIRVTTSTGAKGYKVLKVK